MRKYDMKNKRNIGIVIVISVIIVIMFSLVIKFFLSSSRNEYKVSNGSLVFDINKSIIKLDSDSIIKNKWNNEYYLTYNDKDYELGKTAISFMDNTKEIKLYGKYYEINADSEINITEDETVIKNSLLTKFYKLADRKYLLIDKEIKSSDSLLTTTDFLIVEIDKIGNATLTNHKVNLKTFSETVLVTSNYTFDIANEILSYGNNKIDLKKIIGSSNKYEKEDLIPEDNISSNNGTSNVVINNNAGNDKDSKDNTSGKENKKDNVTIEEIKKEAKNTSVISVTSTINKIVVDYVIYDPYNEFSSVVLEVSEKDSSKVETIFLNKNSTRYEITNGIKPNTKYNLRFRYSYVNDNQELITNEFQNVDINTKKVNISLRVTRTKAGEITYLITPDAGYTVDSGTISVFVNNGEVIRKNIEIDGNTVDNVQISNIMDNDEVEIKLTDVRANGNIISGATASDRFIY